MMGCIENHPKDKGIACVGFLSNAALIHNKFSEIMLSARSLMCHSSLSSEEKDNNF